MRSGAGVGSDEGTWVFYDTPLRLPQEILEDRWRQDTAGARVGTTLHPARCALRNGKAHVILISATCFVHIVAIIMTAIMIIHIRSKYTAVGEFHSLDVHVQDAEASPTGRKEIVMFFWMYAVIELLAMFLDSGIIPTANVSYPVSGHFDSIKCFSNLSLQYFAAVYTGLVASAYCCLLINGFVGFQFAEDGTPLSLWVRLLSVSSIEAYS